ncbi:four helix bundle protein [Arcticibacter sp. MXS-1]|uniref:four helix bundle protein n=1 Tax=Arcticibacter sp. MXS-1 TaxID=3341726 RepID=UPI0035A99AA4
MSKDFKNYTDLDVGREARILVSSIYSATNSYPKEEQFGLTSQIRRSVISIPSNIAEGCGRFHKKDSLHFIYIARGSVYELETQLYLSFDLGFIASNVLQQNLNRLEITRKLLNGLIRYFNNCTEPATQNIQPATQ